MISFIQSLPVGNALRILLNPTPGATRWILLRKSADNFTGFDDAAALPVLDSGVDTTVLDTTALANGTAYFYKEYALVNGAWVASATASAVPQSCLVSVAPDPLQLVRDRLEVGLAAEITKGFLAPQSGAISVLTAPPTFEDTRWPVVTVHLQSDTPIDRAIGEVLFPDLFDSGADTWESSEGWISQIALQVIAWSLNPDERIALRQAIRRVIQGNLPVFDNAGMVQIDFSQSDIDAVSGEYGAPVYQSVGNFNCLAPSIVTAVDGVVSGVTVTAASAPEIFNVNL